MSSHKPFWIAVSFVCLYAAVPGSARIVTISDPRCERAEPGPGRPTLMLTNRPIGRVMGA